MYVFIEWNVTNFSMENYIPLALFYCDYSLKLMKKKTLASHGDLCIHTPLKLEFPSTLVLNNDQNKKG